MYKMASYTGYEQAAILAFMQRHSFAFVIGIGEEYPVVSQLPLQIVEKDDALYLTGHLMRKTDHHLAFEKNANVLVVFHSPHAYIDANWYEDKAQASTVNYMAVHARGKILFTDKAGTLEAIRELTNLHIGTGTAASFENISEEYVAAMLKAIVGFSISVESIEHVFKLSQNKPAADQEKIIENLVSQNDPGAAFIAAQMKDHIDHLRKK